MASPVLLVISENPRRARALADLAGEHLSDWHLATAGSVTEALARLDEADVVLLAAGGAAGVGDAVRQLRQRDYPAHKPVLAVTEEGSPAQVLQGAVEAGADDALSEPVPPDELASRIRLLLTVSRLRRDLAALRRQESAYRWAMEQAPVGLCAVDQEAVITLANPRLAELAGRHVEQVVGRRVEELLEEGQRPTFPQRLARCRRGTDESHELTLATPDGRRRTLLALSRPLLDEAGRVQGCVFAWADTSTHDHRRHQAGLAEHMDAVARLAGQLAHDFNNILTIILGNASLLRRLLTNQPEAAGLVNEIVQAGNRGAELNRRLMAAGFRRRQAAGTVDVHAAVREVARALEHDANRPVRVETRLEAERATVRGEAAPLRSAVQRLAETLRDAMRLGGRVAIHTRTVSLDAIDCERKPMPLSPGRYVELTLAEQAAVPVPAGLPDGPPREAIELDLAGVFATVRSAGGSMEVQTPEEGGLSFTLLLPAQA